MRRQEGVGKLVFGMMQSLDGYVDDVAGGLVLPPPGAALGRHFTDHVRGLAGCLYGRRIYEIMRYWDEDRPSGMRAITSSQRHGGGGRNGSFPVR